MHSILVVVVLFGVAYGSMQLGGGMPLLGAPKEMEQDDIYKDTDLLAGLDMAVEKFNKDSGHEYR